MSDMYLNKIANRLLVIFMLFTMFSGFNNAYAAVAIDSTSSGGQISGTSLTISHTTSGSNRFMLVGVSIEDSANQSVSSMTYSAQAMTLVGTRELAGKARIEIWKLLAPPIGTANVVINLTGLQDKGLVGGVTTFTGVDQTTAPLGNFASSSGDGTQPSVNVTAAVDDIVFSTAIHWNAILGNVGSGETQRWKLAYDKTNAGGSTETATTTSVTMSWSNSNSAWAMGGIAVKPDIIAPAAVSDLVASNPQYTTIDLDWTAPGDDTNSGTATTYDIRYRTDAPITDGNWAGATAVTGEPAPSVATTAESMTVTGLSEGITYYFAIKTSDEMPNTSSISNSPNSKTLSSDLGAPAAVSDLATGTVTGGSVQLTWTAPGDDNVTGTATTYDIRYSTSAISNDTDFNNATQATGEPAPQVASTGESFVVTGLNSSTTYYFAIKTSDEVPNTSALSNNPSDTTTADAGTPGDISDLALSSATNTTIDLDWTAPGDDNVTGTATTYDIRYRTDAAITAGNWSSATQVDDEPTPSIASTAESMTVTGLTVSTTYYFAIKTGDEVVNWSGVSNSPNLSTTNVDETAPAAVLDLSGNALSTTSIQVSWTAPGDDNNTGTATTYDIRYSTSAITESNWASATQATGEPSPSVAGTGQNLTISSLTQDTSYHFAIKTTDEATNTSIISNIAVATTDSDGSNATHYLNADFGTTVATGITTDIASDCNTDYTTTRETLMVSAGYNCSAQPRLERASTGVIVDMFYNTAYTIANIVTGVNFKINIEDKDAAGGQINAQLFHVNSAGTKTFIGTAVTHTTDGNYENVTFDLSTQSTTVPAGEKIGFRLSSNTTHQVRIEYGSGLSGFGGELTIHEAPIDIISPDSVTLSTGAVTNTSIGLSWTAPGDDNVTGTASTYDIRYRTDTAITADNWATSTHVSGEPTPSVATTAESMTVTGLSESTTYYFAIMTGDEVPNWSTISNSPNATTLDAPVGGYTADNVIPTAQVVQSTDGSGDITITWKGRDIQSDNVTLNTFQYSVDGGVIWQAPGNDDASSSLSADWNDNADSNWSTATTLGAATAHSFTFTTKDGTVTGMDGVDQSDVQVRFKLNDGYTDSGWLTSQSFTVDDESPTDTIVSSVYDNDTDTLVITGTNFTTIANAATDIKSYVDWTKFVWDINGDDGTTANITFVEADVTSLTVTDATTLTLVFTGAKGTAIEATAGYGSTGGDDTLDVTAGFSKDYFGNAATTDGVSDATLTTNAPPIGGYTADNVIPNAQVTQATDGSGIITIIFKAKDVQSDSITLNTFEYSDDSGASWYKPDNNDTSGAFSANWDDNSYTSATTFGAAADHNFTFNTKHADVTGSQALDGIDQSDVQIRFTLNDSIDDSALPATSESFQVDDLDPTNTIVSSAYNYATDTLTITGTNFTTIAVATTDIKSYVDWSKFVWDINGDNNTTANITFVEGDITSLTVTDATTLTLVFTGAKGTAIEGTTGYGSTGGVDTIDVTAGFSKDYFGNAATTDGVADGALAIPVPSFDVTKIADTNDGSCDVGDCSLREAIKAANDSAGLNQINVPAGTYTITLVGTDDTNALGDFDITDDVNIVGAGSGLTIIQEGTDLASAVDRIFHVTNSSAVTLEAMKVQFGKVSTDGGCINATSDITINDSIIDSCSSTANSRFGGAIYSGGAITMDSSTVSNSTANHFGGAMSSSGGTLTDVTFTNNHVLYAHGGAIYNIDNLLTINGTANTFTNNYADIGSTDYGGSIYSTGSLTISNASFNGRNDGTNDAGRGGAIYLLDATDVLTLSDSSFSNLRATNSAAAIRMNGGTMSNVTFTDNQAILSHGGAIENFTNLLTITGTNIFDGNRADIGSADYGGSIYSTGSLTISDTTFIGRNDGTNDAGRGGAIYLLDTTDVLTLSDCSFTNIKATNSSGAIFMHGGTMSNVTFTDNQAILSHGGAIENFTNLLTITGTNIFDGNRAGAGSTDYGGTIYSTGSLTISDTTFTGRNDGTGDAGRGGAIYLADTTDVLTLSDSSFASFIAVYDAGAIRMNGGTMSNVTFTDNQANLSHGGAIENFTNLLTITGTNIFDGNRAGSGSTDYGGTIYSTGSLTISNSTFTGRNDASADAGRGGAIYLADTTDVLTLSDSSFASFIALYDAGAIRMNGGTMSNVTFTDNQAQGTDGGAIENLTNLLTITGTNTFTNNDAGTDSGDQGGMIYTTGSLTLSGATVSGSSAYQGGAIYTSAALTITDSSFNVNQSTIGGGAIRSGNGGLTISSSTFSNNSATAATNDGGAIYNTGILNVTNSTFSANTVDDDGGAIYQTTDATIKNSTFYNNSAAGSGEAIYRSAGTVTLENTIVAKSTASASLCVGVTSNDYNLQYNGTCFTAAANDISGDPLLNALTDNGGPTMTHSLQAASPAIDFANTATCAAAPVNNLDQRGGTRPINGGTSLDCDMGSYEYGFFINSYPFGGYTEDNVIPAAQIIQSSNGDGIMTINWKARDTNADSITLNTFEYSVNGGVSWNAPTNADASASLSTNWDDNGGGGFTSASTFGAATDHNFTLNTKHADVTGLDGVDQSDVRIRFKLNDGTDDSALSATSEIFQVDNLAPTSTITSASYNKGSDTLTITGTNFTTIAAASTDVKSYVDWTKFIWDINGDNGTTADISFVEANVTSLTVTNATTLTLIFTAATGTAIEATSGFGAAGGSDTLDITAGFSIDLVGNTAATDGTADAPLTIVNFAPFGGYTADNVIPTAQVTQSTNGDGIVTINFRLKDTDGDSVTLNTFEYSVDGGTGWNAPTNGDASLSLSTNWEDNGSSYATAVDWSGAVYSLTFDTDHADTTGLASVDQADVQVRFTVNDAAVDSALPATSESFQVDNLSPTDTIVSSSYSSAADTLTITGTDFTTIATASTDIKSYVDWSKFIWDINGDNNTTANITFVEADITSFTVTNATTLTLVFTGAAGTAIEATAGYGSTGGADTLDVTTGFSKDVVGNAATTDGVADAAITLGVAISGTVYTDEGTTTIADGATVRLIVNGASVGTDTTSSGAYSINTSVSAGDAIIAYIDGHASDGTTVTVSDGNALTGLDIYADHLIVRHDNSGSLTNANMTTALGAYSDAEILYTTDGSDNLTVSGSATELYVPTGHSYTPGVNISTTDIEIIGTLTAGSNTITVAGDWDNSAGTFVKETSTVDFNGTGSITTTEYAHPFYNLTVGAAGEITTTAEHFTVDNVLTVGAGEITGPNVIYLTTLNPLSLHSSATISLVYLFFTGGGAQNLPPHTYDCGIKVDSTGTNVSQTGDVTINGILFVNGNWAGEAKIVTYNTAGYDLTVNGKIEIGYGDDTGLKTFDATNSAVSVSGDFKVVPVGAGSAQAITVMTGSTVTFNGTADQTITSSGSSFDNVTLNNTGTDGSIDNIFIADALDIDGDLLITDGVLDTTASNYAMTVTGAITDTVAGRFKANASTISVDGNFTLDANSDATESTDFNNASVILTGTGGLTYANVAAYWVNGFNNLTVGQSGNTTTLNSSIQVRDVLTVGSGEITGNAHVVSMLGTGDVLAFDVNSKMSFTQIRLFGTLNLPTLSNGYDCDIRISASNTVTQTGHVTINGNNSLEVNGDVFANRSPTYSTAGFDLIVGGDIIIGVGNDTAQKTLNGTNSSITVGGNFSLNDGGTPAAAFTSTGSTVEVNGTSQAINGSVTFNNLTKSVAAADTLTFEAGKTTTINGTVTLNGASGQLLTLASSTGSSAWNFNVAAGATKAIDYVSVSWSDASGSHATQKAINPTNSTDGGNNSDWFTAPTITVSKLSFAVSDPINGTNNPKRIPGAIVRYMIVPSNSGDASPDANSTVVNDIVDSTKVSYDVVTGVSFVDGTTSSALALGTVTFSSTASPGPYIYDYTPSGSYDDNVTSIKVTTTGTFANGGAPAPSFSIEYKAQIK